MNVCVCLGYGCYCWWGPEGGGAHTTVRNWRLGNTTTSATSHRLRYFFRRSSLCDNVCVLFNSFRTTTLARSLSFTRAHIFFSLGLCYNTITLITCGSRWATSGPRTGRRRSSRTTAARTSCGRVSASGRASPGSRGVSLLEWGKKFTRLVTFFRWKKNTKITSIT